VVFGGTGLKSDDIHFVVGTGYGRVNIPFADKAITEIACHGRGANFMGGPTVRTILDMGGQDCKAIHIDERGKVTNFLMNDKCAAGTGRGMEVIADLLEVPIEELGPRSFDIEEEPPAVSDVCVVFAKSEAMGRLKEGWSKNRVIASYCRAMAERVTALLERIGVEPDFLITGGISKNIGVVRRIEEIIGTPARKTDFDAQVAGALGAALFAHTLKLKREEKKP
jgi:benzoyl-CoA reductase subunit A